MEWLPSSSIAYVIVQQRRCCRVVANDEGIVYTSDGRYAVNKDVFYNKVALNLLTLGASHWEV